MEASGDFALPGAKWHGAAVCASGFKAEGQGFESSCPPAWLDLARAGGPASRKAVLSRTMARGCKGRLCWLGKDPGRGGQRLIRHVSESGSDRMDKLRMLWAVGPWALCALPRRFRVRPLPQDKKHMLRSDEFLVLKRIKPDISVDSRDIRGLIAQLVRAYGQ